MATPCMSTRSHSVENLCHVSARFAASRSSVDDDIVRAPSYQCYHRTARTTRTAGRLSWLCDTCLYCQPREREVVLIITIRDVTPRGLTARASQSRARTAERRRGGSELISSIWNITDGKIPRRCGTSPNETRYQQNHTRQVSGHSCAAALTTPQSSHSRHTKIEVSVRSTADADA